MKGYPKSQFDVINDTYVSEIETNAISGATAVMMAAYTSDKGSEDWELLYGLDNFTTKKGGLNFTRHGQSQLLVANMLANGAYVLAKRMVSQDATLANATIKARVIKADNVSYLYLYSVSSTNALDFNAACVAGYGDFNAANNATEVEASEGGASYTTIDIPLFTVAAVGRGTSSIFFRLEPEYYASKSTNFIKYSFEVIENSNALESILCTMNPDIIIDGSNQSIQTKVNKNSSQVKTKVYEDGVAKLVKVLAETANLSGTPIKVSELVNMDFINGIVKKSGEAISGIVTKTTAGEALDLWTSFKPADITVCYALDDATGIPLAGGSYGTMGTSPVENQEEYTKLLLATYGKNQESTLFDPIIYDLDQYKVDAIFDCNYPLVVKNAIIDLVDFRGDCVFLADLGTKHSTLEEIVSAANEITSSKFVAVYHNYFNIIDPYTKKEITVTMPYLLASKLIAHISNGVGRPFAGIANNIKFSEIIEGTVNFLPVIIPGLDQKQQLVDANVNYISYYDGVPVMETMYTNDDQYTQLSFLHNIMAIQEIIKLLRTRCPKTRYTFLDGDDLETYIDDAKSIINEYSTNFASIDMTYMADEKYESNNIFYAVIKVRFKNFVQEEYFRVIAIE